MLLKPDPIAYTNALLAAGHGHEALRHITDVVEKLTQTLQSVATQRVEILSELFVLAAAKGDALEAMAHFKTLVTIYKDKPLADALVEARYFRACFAIRNRPVPIERKHRHMALVAQLRSVFGHAGEIAECGCYRGLSAWMICETLNEENGGFDGTGFHIFDSFAGLSEPSAEDLLTEATEDRARLAKMLHKGRFAHAEDKVRRNLAAFPGITYHAGWLPQSLEGQPERRYRFVHVDVDLYAPSLGALEYFYPRLVPGGLILTDDYGWPGSRLAFDEFCGRHGLKLEILPGNQAVLRK